jgi:hypothetical protein
MPANKRTNDLDDRTRVAILNAAVVAAPTISVKLFQGVDATQSHVRLVVPELFDGSAEPVRNLFSLTQFEALDC